MQFRLAKNTDDQAIRNLLKQIPLNGILRIRFHREPSYLSSLQKQGIFQQTIVGESAQGELLAVASRNIQKLFVDNQPLHASYISSVRIHPKAVHGVSLLKGIRSLEKLVSPIPIDFHYATLIEKDPLTRKVFATGKPSMPSLVDLGKITTYSIPLKKKPLQIQRGKKITIKKCTEQDFPQVLDFLNKEGKKLPLFPVIDPENYHPDLITPENFYAAYENDRIVGVCNVINMQENKRYTIEGFSWKYRLLKWPINFTLAIRGLYSMPIKNEEVKMLTIGFPVTEDSRIDVFERLLTYIYATYSGTGNHYLSMALHEINPLNYAVSHFPKVKYESRLYIVKLKSDQSPAIEINKKSYPFIDFPRL